jgi:hypothetical protein
MYTPNIWGMLKSPVAAATLSGGFPWARNVYVVGANVPSAFGARVNTIAAALELMIPNDILFLGPGGHAEGNLSIPATLTNITIIGAGNRGCSFIEPSGANDEGLEVLADDVTLINVGIAKGTTADYALSVGSASVSPDRFRAYGCKIEGDGVAARLYGAGDVLIDDCEFCWCATALQLRSNAVGFNTQIYIRNSRFHNYTTAGVGEFANAQQVNNLLLADNLFERQEDGTAGTDDILLQDNLNTGLITGNRFPRATNGTGFITIGTGLIYNPNGTEAGWSTARPA